MLTLTRKADESIYLVSVQGYDILEMQAVIRRIHGREVSVGVEAPGSIAIYRSEIYNRIRPLLNALHDDCTSATEFERRAREYLRTGRPVYETSTRPQTAFPQQGE